MKVVEIDGRISKAGGRVVKNVTGYDLQKLYTGSLGTLASIVGISLKLGAKLGRTGTGLGSLQYSGWAVACLASLRKSPLQPVACEWFGPGIGGLNSVWLRFGEDPRAV